ncbi:MAG: SAM-dependent methyltransferase [Parcubacteria group bacterium GW2011_GWA1_47_8]|nr:MAG: SAM-dependent methyltransferase [Parcubacteria group bacterium GW2011_GWA1_47_8]
MAGSVTRISRNRMENCHKKLNCSICGSADLPEVLDLGVMPLANAFLDKESLDTEEPQFPLVVNFCPNCFLVQLGHVVDGELLFKNYHYTTSASAPLVQHFNKLADEIAGDYVKSPDDLVVEIGSNDGSLLSRIKDRCRVLGIDPADKITELAVARHVPTIHDFFSAKLAESVRSEFGPARVVVANNVMAHIDDIRDVFSGVKTLLADDGQFIFEVHWVGNLLTEGGFDQIYHEHLYYHSLHSVKALLDSLGMVVNDIRLVPIHGESMRVYASKSGESSVAVQDFLNREIEMGLTESSTYVNFSKKIESNKAKLVGLLSELKARGKKIVGYGASAKGNTLLNYFHIGSDVLDYITDTTPLKQGTYTPGTHIPVVSPEKIITDTPDYILLLSWNYADAIMEKEKDLRRQGVKFIIPVPDVRIV